MLLKQQEQLIILSCVTCWRLSPWSMNLKLSIQGNIRGSGCTTRNDSTSYSLAVILWFILQDNSHPRTNRLGPFYISPAVYLMINLYWDGWLQLSQNFDYYPTISHYYPRLHHLIPWISLYMTRSHCLSMFISTRIHLGMPWWGELCLWKHSARGGAQLLWPGEVALSLPLLVDE